MTTEHLLGAGEVAYRTCGCDHCPEIAIGCAGARCCDCENAGCSKDGCELEDEIFAECFPDQELTIAIASDQTCTLDCDCDYNCICYRQVVS